jgi:hypothetical protein
MQMLNSILQRLWLLMLLWRVEFVGGLRLLQCAHKLLPALVPRRLPIGNVHSLRKKIGCGKQIGCRGRNKSSPSKLATASSKRNPAEPAPSTRYTLMRDGKRTITFDDLLPFAISLAPKRYKAPVVAGRVPNMSEISEFRFSIC